MKKNITHWFLACTAILALAGCQAGQPSETAPKMETVSGTLAYRERIALPSEALVTVTLQDVSLADAPAKVIAKQQFSADGAQVPFTFELSYDPSQIDARHTYSVSARIEVDGKLRFISDTAYRVITDEAKTQQVNLLLKGVR
ncbi:YbaY family lipoprotein [Vibrio scophthalmi]|uniref:YbaY family lipoprotein n=1 Tax=Vibrio scophthalmi TaxID=45658 RepID=UPI002FF2ABD9